MKTIQQYFAEMSAAGLVPDCKQAHNIYACQVNWFECWHIKLMEKNQRDPFSVIIIPYSIIAKSGISVIQLRSNGKDLAKLEWQKPTEQDVGKMCWFYSCDYSGFITLSELGSCDEERMKHDESYLCLLATHGRLCPEPSDFEEVYKC